MPTHSYRDLFVGLDVRVPLLDGSQRTYINLDNAASTPALKSVEQAVTSFPAVLQQRPPRDGFKSQLSTHAYEEARRMVMDFVGADPAAHTCIFGKNTTEMVNHLARRFPFTRGTRRGPGQRDGAPFQRPALAGGGEGGARAGRCRMGAWTKRISTRC